MSSDSVCAKWCDAGVALHHSVVFVWRGNIHLYFLKILKIQWGFFFVCFFAYWQHYLFCFLWITSSLLASPMYIFWSGQDLTQNQAKKWMMKQVLYTSTPSPSINPGGGKLSVSKAPFTVVQHYSRSRRRGEEAFACSRRAHIVFGCECYGNCCCNTEHAAQDNKKRSGVRVWGEKEGRGSERAS